MKETAGCEPVKTEIGIRYALSSLVWALGSAHDGSFADAGNILKPIADALEDVYSARIVREVKP